MLTAWTGGTILIKRLDNEEINLILHRLERLKDNGEFKEYFEFGNDFPSEAYLINNSYYVDIFTYKGAKFFGFIKLNDENINLKEVITLFCGKFEECGTAGYWFVETHKMDKFNKMAIRYMKRRGAKIKTDIFFENDKKVCVTLFMK